MKHPDQSPTPARPRIEIVNQPDLDLSVLGPEEVRALWRYLVQFEDKDERYRTPEQEGLARLWSDLGATLELLPERDLEFGRAVYTAFAVSPFADERSFLGPMIGHLTRIDHDHGLALWKRLIRDPELYVRSAAHELVDHAYGRAQKADDYGQAEATLMTDVGLTPGDAMHLLEVYERGEHAPDLGEVALQRLTAPPHA